jgi:hypothetical protein
LAGGQAAVSVKLFKVESLVLRLGLKVDNLQPVEGEDKQESQLAEASERLSKMESLVLRLGLEVDTSQPVGGEDKQESQLAEVSERLSKVEGLVVNLGVKFDELIHRISRLDVLNDGVVSSLNDIVQVGKAVNAMGEVLAKSLHKEASPTGSDQKPPSKRCKV